MAIADVEGDQLGEVDDRRKNPDRRDSPRQKVLRGGRTYWPNGDSSECMVHNLSETGAQLELRGPAPNRFDLVVEGDRWRRSCSVVWRRVNRVGVRFHDLPQVAPSAGKSKYGRYVEECRLLAKRANNSDREILLEMADAWTIVVRRLRRRAR